MQVMWFYLALPHGLEDLVKICEQFAIEYGVTFNAKKTQCIYALVGMIMQNCAKYV